MENAMDGVYEIIKHAGRIPLDELVLRSSEPPEKVTQTINMLVEKGIVSVTGPLPTTPQDAAQAKDTVIELTTRGLSAAV